MEVVIGEYQEVLQFNLISSLHFALILGEP